MVFLTEQYTEMEDEKKTMHKDVDQTNHLWLHFNLNEK